MEVLTSPNTNLRGEAVAFLQEQGTWAVSALLRLFEEGGKAERRAALLALGKLEVTDESLSVLAGALRESDAKLRKNAIVSLGRIGDEACKKLLLDHLGQEELRWVRAVVITALAECGGEDVVEVLRGLSPEGLEDKEREALRRALDGLTRERKEMGWDASAAWSLPLELVVQRGLEDIAREEAEKGGIEVESSSPGRLICAPGTRPEPVLPLRTVFHPRIVLSRERSQRRQALVEQIRGMIRSDVWSVLAEHLSDASSLRYRFALEGPAWLRKHHRACLGALRGVLQKRGWHDSPSNYHMTFIVRMEGNRISLECRPYLKPDLRFSYRKKDVGASIHPAVAATLVNMVRTEGAETVLDPTCGSATMLIERWKVGFHGKLYGFDISARAKDAAETNRRAATLSGIKIVKKDTLKARWPESCDEILANLPFGVRVKGRDASPETLYGPLMKKISEHLVPEKGRALVYTSATEVADEAIASLGGALQVLERRVIPVGGLDVGVWLLKRVV